MNTHQETVKARNKVGAKVSQEKAKEIKKQPTLMLWKGNNRTDCLITCDRMEYI